MFKRRRKGRPKTQIVREKKFGWFRRIFKKKSVRNNLNKTIQKKQSFVKKPSVTTLFRNKIHKSKLNIKDIELIEGMDSYDLKRKFSITGSKAKVLEGMVADYKRGRLSLPGLSHKSKFQEKELDKTRLNQMINDYDIAKRQKILEEAQKNAKELKKKFSMTASQGKKLDKVIEDLNKGKGSKMELANKLLDPKKLTKERVNKLIQQYDEAQRKNRGLSYMITQSKLSFFVSKQKINNLMENLKDVGISGMLKKYS